MSVSIKIKNAILSFVKGDYINKISDWSNCSQEFAANKQFSVDSTNIIGKNITKVKFLCGAEGTVNLYKSAYATASSRTLIGSLTCTSSDVGNVVEKEVTFNIATGQYLCVGCSVAGVLKYLYNSGGLATYYNQLLSSSDGSPMEGRDLYMDFYEPHS